MRSAVEEESDESHELLGDVNTPPDEEEINYDIEFDNIGLTLPTGQVFVCLFVCLCLCLCVCMCVCVCVCVQSLSLSLSLSLYLYLSPRVLLLSV